jgi:two-component system, chemotaxis family, protein-glutamate methylesterase/glutaminase
VARHDIIVIGASAGGVRALELLVAGLPADLEASLFVVLHLSPWIKSVLPEILSRSGKLPAVHPRNGEAIRPGRIYVAPPDYHLLVDHGAIECWHGPKENRQRPSINPLFRSAAVTYGPRVVGVVLSGRLDDGSAGLWWVKRYGGIAIVQHPEQAEYPDMPLAAMQYIAVDYLVGVPEMPALLTKLARGEMEAPENKLRIKKEAPQWKPSR